MRTVILGERPVELERWIAHRRATGADTHDEIWEGAYHMSPAPNDRHSLLAGELAGLLYPHAKRRQLYGGTEFNLGGPADYRVPDYGIRRGRTSQTYLDTAALVVEVVSPGDESWDKLPFYAAHHVDEVIIADPTDRTLVWMALVDGAYHPVDHSDLLAVDVADIVDTIDWPPVADDS